MDPSVVTPLRIAIDYRPALRARTGVGEYVYQLVRALRQEYPNDLVTLFTSSWKDRPAPGLSQTLVGASISDHRIPVRLLNMAWHNLELPRVEWLTRRTFDVAFSPHPLLLPASSAQVVMVHDLDFLKHPERTEREIRRDYPRLARPHAHRAARIVVPSQYTAAQVEALLHVPRSKIAVCPAGFPEWARAPRGFDRTGYLLFVGSLEPRKNLSQLLTAYEELVTRLPALPRLVLAGRLSDGMNDLLHRTTRPPLVGRVDHLGYVSDAERQSVYEGARALVLPSFDEGFGMPALEAMSLGIPVVASDRGALPELVGDAGILIDPTSEADLAEACRQVLTDDGLAQDLADRGRSRAATFSWRRTAQTVRQAFAEAVGRRGQPLSGSEHRV